MLVAVLSVPWMLLVKPFYLRHQNNQKVQRGPGFSRFVDDGINGDPDGINHGEIVHTEDTALHREEEEEEVFDFGEVCFRLIFKFIAVLYHSRFVTKSGKKRRLQTGIPQFIC